MNKTTKGNIPVRTVGSLDAVLVGKVYLKTLHRECIKLYKFHKGGAYNAGQALAHWGIATSAKQFLSHCAPCHKSSFTFQVSRFEGSKRTITCEVDGANGVDVVVHIGGVGAALTAVRARKLRPWSSQPDAQPVPAHSPSTPSIRNTAIH